MKDKSVLVVDTPSRCGECQFRVFADSEDLDNDYIFCGIAHNGTMFHFDADKPKWCPLRTLPLKMQFNETDLYVDGWNACLEQITGETE